MGRRFLGAMLLGLLEEKDLASTAVFLLSEPVSLTEPMPGALLEAVFMEDQYKLRPWLTLTAGVRLTHFSGALSENAASPRLGVTLRIPGWNWRLSAPPFLRRLRLRQRGQQQGVALLQRSAAERQAFPHGRRQSRTSQATPDDS